MITKIEIDGFKSFINFSMELRPLTVVVGANAAGKSNLLDALRIFSKIVLEDLPEALQSERGNGTELFHRTSSRQFSNFFITIQNEDGDLLRVSCTKMRGHIFETNKGFGRVSPRLEIKNLNKIDKFYRQLSRYIKFENIGKSIKHLDPIPHQLRQPGADIGSEDVEINTDGLHLPNALIHLKNNKHNEGRTLFDALQEALARLVPGVRNVEVRHDEEVAEYRLSIITRDGTKLPARLASDGTLRMLALLTALYSPKGGTLCFEEPENGLHPGQLRALIELFVERTAVTIQPSMQVIATSHSPVVLAALLEARRASPEQIGLYFMDTARHIPEGATDPSQISTVSRVRRVGDEGESGRDVVPWREVERYLNTAIIQDGLS